MIFMRFYDAKIKIMRTPAKYSEKSTRILKKVIQQIGIGGDQNLGIKNSLRESQKIKAQIGNQTDDEDNNENKKKKKKKKKKRSNSWKWIKIFWKRVTNN